MTEEKLRQYLELREALLHAGELSKVAYSDGEVQGDSGWVWDEVAYIDSLLCVCHGRREDLGLQPDGQLARMEVSREHFDDCPIKDLPPNPALLASIEGMLRQREKQRIKGTELWYGPSLEQWRREKG